MTIIAMSQIAIANNVEDQIGYILYQACLGHFTQYLGQSGLGISYTSCNAAVAVTPSTYYPAVQQMVVQGANFAVSYGSSRLFSGIDPDFNAMHGHLDNNRTFSNSPQYEEHAEQTAIKLVADNGRTFWTCNNGGTPHHHLYVEFSPCEDCDPWLRARAENWYVHYSTPVTNQAPVVKEKKSTRSDTFGRQMEKKVS